MEPKKNKPYDLHTRYPLFFSIGLFIALLLVTVAFEWRAQYSKIDLEAKQDVFEPMLDVVITRIDPPKLPEPPKVIQDVNPQQIRDVVSTTEELTQQLTEPTSDPVPDFDLPPLPPVDETPEVFDVVESMPAFPGGWEAFYRYVSKEVEYPSKARRIGVEGKVFVSFVIDENGRVTEVKAIKGPGFGLEEEAIRVLENSPLFIPGKQRGRAVRVRQVLPIHFTLN